MRCAMLVQPRCYPRAVACQRDDQGIGRYRNSVTSVEHRPWACRGVVPGRRARCAGVFAQGGGEGRRWAW